MRRAWVILLAVMTRASAQTSAPTDPLATLRHEHPRLLRTKEGFAELKKAVAKDRVLNEWKHILETTDAQEIRLTLPNTPPMTAAGQAELATYWITTEAGLYRITGDPRMAERAREELVALAKFPDWSPKAELIFGRTTRAVALGYDWLYDSLSPDERKLICDAIVEKGLKAGMAFYDTQYRWVQRNENHNQVANSCMILGALAVADEQPEIARKVLLAANQSLRHSMPSFNPDGGWAEGPGYWVYGTGHLTDAFAAMETAIGNTMGLADFAGYNVTGNFPMHATGPFGHAWSFSDGDEWGPVAPELLWLARKYNHPEWGTFERQLVGNRPGIMDLIFAGDSAPAAAMPKDLPRDAIFRETDAVCFRSNWDDPAATWVGFKAGHERLGHWHMDVGSFCFDSQNERFAIDLGNENYAIGEYFGRKRYDYFRTRNESHNTLTINGEIQDRAGKAPIVAYRVGTDSPMAVADLSAAYKLPPGSLYRGVALIGRRDLLVQDDFSASIKGPLDVVWNMYTRAEIDLHGRDALLTIRGARLHAHLLAPAEARFEIGSADAPAEEMQQPDVHSLRIHLQIKSPGDRIVVLLSPAADAPRPEIKSLSSWIDEAPVK